MKIIGDDIPHRRVISLNSKAIQLRDGMLYIRHTWNGYWTPFCECFEVGDGKINILDDLITFGSNECVIT